MQCHHRGQNLYHAELFEWCSLGGVRPDFKSCRWFGSSDFPNWKIITIFGNYLINCLLNEFGLLVNTIKYKLNHQNQDLKSSIKFGSLVLNKNHQSWKSSGLCHRTSGYMTTLHVGTNPRNKAVY